MYAMSKVLLNLNGFKIFFLLFLFYYHYSVIGIVILSYYHSYLQVIAFLIDISTITPANREIIMDPEMIKYQLNMNIIYT